MLNINAITVAIHGESQAEVTIFDYPHLRDVFTNLRDF